MTADSIALLAVLIACSAVVIVLAEDVALVAAVFSFDAAAVTLVAAADTARGVVDEIARFAVVRVAAARLAVVPAARVAVGRTVAGLVAALAVAGLVVERLAAGLADLAAGFFADAAALAVLALPGPDLAVSVGTDLPPRSGSDTGSLIPLTQSFTHRCLVEAISTELERPWKAAREPSGKRACRVGMTGFEPAAP